MFGVIVEFEPTQRFSVTISCDDKTTVENVISQTVQHIVNGYLRHLNVSDFEEAEKSICGRLLRKSVALVEPQKTIKKIVEGEEGSTFFFVFESNLQDYVATFMHKCDTGDCATMIFENMTVCSACSAVAAATKKTYAAVAAANGKRPTKKQRQQARKKAETEADASMKNIAEQVWEEIGVDVNVGDNDNNKSSTNKSKTTLKIDGNNIYITVNDLFQLRVCKRTNTLQTLQIWSNSLSSILRNHKTMKNNNLFSNTYHDIDAETMYRYLGPLLKVKDTMKNKEEFWEFRAAVLPYYEKRLESIKETLKDGKIAYPDLWYVYNSKTEVKLTTRDSILGCRLKQVYYNDGFFPFFGMEASYIQSDGVQFGRRSRTVSIGAYAGLKNLSELPVKILSAKEKDELMARGLMFEKFALKASHMHYDGVMFFESYFGIDRKHTRGRVMVDVLSFSEDQPNYREFRSFSQNQRYGGDETIVQTALEPSQRWMAWPTLPAFCLQSKNWGEVRIEHLTEIQFRVNAFDQLVLPAATKKLIRAVVDSQMNNAADLFGDIIAGKGNGTILLLHGPPGVGKTSSAEATAEERQCPLYSVTVGELGTEAGALETSLTKVLAIAARWKAVILLDEADIFLERRTERDVKRNAMVSIFLRLLEYHQGVLFMTTNRIGQFDEAFLSRISIALSYKEFDTTVRAKVWTNLLKAANASPTLLDKDVLDKLAYYEINGRQIRTIIRMAGAVAMQEARPICYNDLESTIRLTIDFVSEVSGKK